MWASTIRTSPRCGPAQQVSGGCTLCSLTMMLAPYDTRIVPFGEPSFLRGGQSDATANKVQWRPVCTDPPVPQAIMIVGIAGIVYVPIGRQRAQVKRWAATLLRLENEPTSQADRTFHDDATWSVNGRQLRCRLICPHRRKAKRCCTVGRRRPRTC